MNYVLFLYFRRENLTSRFVFKEIPVKVAGRELPIALIVLEMVDYDVILGIDWLSKYNATIFCSSVSTIGRRGVRV